MPVPSSFLSHSIVVRTNPSSAFYQVDWTWQDLVSSGIGFQKIGWQNWTAVAPAISNKSCSGFSIDCYLEDRDG